MPSAPSLHFIGFGLRNTHRPEGWNGPAHVTSICSVSECVNSAPEGWIDRWLHNDFGFFDTPALALAVTDAPRDFELLSYRLLDITFSDPDETGLDRNVFPQDVLVPGARVIGYDIVSRSISDFFECSPLSCNGLANEVPVNQYCLVPTLETAILLARRFAAEEPEPGPYYVLEVSVVPPPGV